MTFRCTNRPWYSSTITTEGCLCWRHFLLAAAVSQWLVARSFAFPTRQMATYFQQTVAALWRAIQLVGTKVWFSFGGCLNWQRLLSTPLLLHVVRQITTLLSTWGNSGCMCSSCIDTVDHSSRLSEIDNTVEVEVEVCMTCTWHVEGRRCAQINHSQFTTIHAHTPWNMKYKQNGIWWFHSLFTLHTSHPYQYHTTYHHMHVNYKIVIVTTWQ